VSTIRKSRRPRAGTAQDNRRRGNILLDNNRLLGSIPLGNRLPVSIRPGNRPPVSISPGSRLLANIRPDRRRRDSIPAVNIPGITRPIQVRAILPNLRRSTRVRILAVRIVRGVHPRSIRIAVPTIVHVAVRILLARGTKSMIRASAHRRRPADSHGPSCPVPAHPRMPTARATSGIAATARACACRASRAKD
jgi:hypothetical protein